MSRNIYPSPMGNGAATTYQITKTTLIQNQMCNFAILMPTSADPNDILNVTIVFLSNLDATLIKGASLDTATNMYTVSAG